MAGFAGLTARPAPLWPRPLLPRSMTQSDSQGRDAAPAPPPRVGARSWRARLTAGTAVLCWLYAAALVVLWLLLLVAADRWWIGTAAMYSPRWLYSLPLIALLPPALLCRRRSTVVPLALAILVLLGPVMHLCIPWRRALPGHNPRGAGTLRLITLNADSATSTPRHSGGGSLRLRPDLIALQALASGHHQRDLRREPRLRTAGTCTGTDELLLASRYPITASRVYDYAAFVGGDGGVLAGYDLHTPAGTVHLFNLHVDTPRYALLAVAGRRSRRRGEAVECQHPAAAPTVRNGAGMGRRGGD